MAILKIARMGHPVLQRVAEPVDDPTAPEIRRLLDDMLETMRDAEGMGIAAPQVHIPLRVVIFVTPLIGTEDADPDEYVLTEIINPVITTLDDDMAEGWEGCLSVPGLKGLVSRYRHVHYSGLDPQGEPIERTAKSIHARVVQHECDHLDGLLYPYRLKDMNKLIFDSEYRHHTVTQRPTKTAEAEDNA